MVPLTTVKEDVVYSCQKGGQLPKFAFLGDYELATAILHR